MERSSKPQTRWALEQLRRSLDEGKMPAVIEIGEYLVAHAAGELPTYLLALFTLGLAYEQTGDWPRALDRFRQCHSLEPDNRAAVAGRGRVLLKMGRFAEAADLFQQLIRKHPDRAEYHQAAGSALLRMGQLESAVASLRRAHEIEPHNPYILNDLAGSQIIAGDLDSALESYREAVDHIGPEDLGLAREIRASIQEVRAAVELQERASGLSHQRAQIIDLSSGGVAEPAAPFEPAMENPPAPTVEDPVRAELINVLPGLGCRPRQVLAALNLWSDFLETQSKPQRGYTPKAIPCWTAALFYTIGRLDTEQWAVQKEVARAFGISPSTLSQYFKRLRVALRLEIGDPRYCTSPCFERDFILALPNPLGLPPGRLLLT